MRTTTTTTRERSVPRVDAFVWLALMIGASIALRLALNTRFDAPTILTDELTYSQLARQIADGQFNLSSGYGVIYPVLMAPSWAVANYGTDAYTLMKATNAVLVSLTAIPVFLWARRMMGQGYALIAAGLTLLMPSMAYSGHIMTENAFVLFFMIAVWAIAVGVERPTVLNQALMLLALILACACRVQAVALLPALPVIIVLAAIAEERSTGDFGWKRTGRRLLRWWPLATLGALGTTAIFIRSLTTDWHWNQLLQAYSATADGQYTASNVGRYLLWHFGEATFALGIIPVAALLVLLGMGAINRLRTSAERAYLCTAVVAIPVVILQVATFTSYWSQRVSERNMFCVFPIALIGLALWLDHGLPRTRRTTGLAAAVTGSLVLIVPFGYLYPLVPSTETWALVLPEILTRKVAYGGYDVQVLIVLGTAIALYAFGIVRARTAVVALPLILVSVFAVTQAAVVHSVGKYSGGLRSALGMSPDANWLDRNVPQNASVTMIFGGPAGPDAENTIMWEMAFFNRRAIKVVRWGTDVVSSSTSGAILDASGSPASLGPYVVTPSQFDIAGRVVAQQNGYLLIAPSTPARLAAQSWGFFADSWAGPSATYVSYENETTRPIDLDFDLTHAPSGFGSNAVDISMRPLTQPSTATTGDSPATRLEIPAHGTAKVSITPPPGPYALELKFRTSFKGTDYGIPDSRELSAMVSLSSAGDELTT